MNNHNLLEIPLNLSDVTLNGTENYIKSMDEVINKIQLRIDLDEVEMGAYELN